MQAILQKWRDKAARLHDRQCSNGQGRYHLPAAISEINLVMALLENPNRDENELSNRLKRILGYLDGGGFFSDGE